jgi:hypothetical protein
MMGVQFRMLGQKYGDPVVSATPYSGDLVMTLLQLPNIMLSKKSCSTTRRHLLFLGGGAGSCVGAKRAARNGVLQICVSVNGLPALNKLLLPNKVASQWVVTPAPAHPTPLHFGLLRTACAPASTHSNGFCAIWVSISSSSSGLSAPKLAI